MAANRDCKFHHFEYLQHTLNTYTTKDLALGVSTLCAVVSPDSLRARCGNHRKVKPTPLTATIHSLRRCHRDDSNAKYQVASSGDITDLAAGAQLTEMDSDNNIKPATTQQRHGGQSRALSAIDMKVARHALPKAAALVLIITEAEYPIIR